MGGINDKKIKVDIDKSVPQVVQSNRCIPLNMLKDAEDELDHFEKMDELDKVEDPTPWMNSIVLVPITTGG